MKITVQLPVQRDGEQVEASLAVDETGSIIIDLPTVARKPKVSVVIERNQLDDSLAALDRLAPRAAEAQEPQEEPQEDPGEEAAEA